MKVKTRETAKTVSGAAKDGASRAQDTLKDARKQARRQLIRARVATARARAGTRAKVSAKASSASTKAVGAAGAAGLAAGYFLDPDSGKRRRHLARDRAFAVIRRGADRTRREAEYRAAQVEGKVEA